MSIRTVRFIKWFFVWLFVTTPLELIGLPILAVVLLFTPKEAVQLPSIFGYKLFRFWDNYESYVLDHNDPDLDGLAGPDYYRKRENLNLDNYFTRWYNRLNWLGIRNPANYFHYVAMGAVMDGKPVLTVQDPPFVDIDKEGGKQRSVTHDGKYFEYYYVLPYRFKSTHALRLRWGWKISSSHRPLQQWVFVINPFFKLG